MDLRGGDLDAIWSPGRSLGEFGLRWTPGFHARGLHVDSGFRTRCDWHTACLRARARSSPPFEILRGTKKFQIPYMHGWLAPGPTRICWAASPPSAAPGFRSGSFGHAWQSG